MLKNNISDNNIVFAKVKFSNGLVTEHKYKFNIHEINAM